MLKRFYFAFTICFNITHIFAQVKIGDIAPDFSLKNIDGNFISLQSEKNAKGYIIVFTCNHCPFAQLYEQRIIDLDNKYRPLGYPVIAINPNDAKKVPEDSYEQMKKRAREKNYPFPYLHDETQYTARQYGATRTPQVFVLQRNDKKEHFLVAYIGAIDNDTENVLPKKNNYVQDAVNALLNGKEPKIKETKAIGCSIKWKN